MGNIYGMLGLNSELLGNFALQSRDVEKNIEIDRILRIHERRFKEIDDKFKSDGRRPDFNQQSVDQLIEKVKRDASSKKEEWTVRELRMMTYYLSRFQATQSVFEHALNLLEKNWRNLFINGIVFYLMNSWTMIPENIRTITGEMLKRHLRNYDGSIRKYCQLRDRSDYFDSAGPFRLAALLIAKGKSLDEAPDILGFKASALSFAYFSDVIIEYLTRTSVSDYDSIEYLFQERHKIDRTKMLLYAHMIEYADSHGSLGMQANVSRSAMRILGDINLVTTWTPFAGATDDEKDLLRRAQDLVCSWAARKSVEAFFNICVQDSRRRKCWLEYVRNVSDFRIVGSDLTRTRLLSNASVASLLKTHFIETNSRVSTTAALVLFIRDKVFVEFSDVGSLYIYNNTHRLVKYIKNKRFLDNTSDLKDTGIGMALDSIQNGWYNTTYDYNDEGRITHRGEWEERFRRWMRNKMRISPGQKPQFQTSSAIGGRTASTSQTTFQAERTKVVSSPVKNYQAAVRQPTLFDNDICFKESHQRSKGSDSEPRMKENSNGVLGKWVFDDQCRILAARAGIYLELKKNGKTYFLTSNPFKNDNVCAVLMKSIYNSSSHYEVQLTSQNSRIGKSFTQTIGRLTLKSNNIVFSPLRGQNVVINTQ